MIFLLITHVLVSALPHPTGDPPFNGRKGRKIVYTAERHCGQSRQIRFTTEVEQVLFALNSVQGKFKVLRLQIENGCDTDLKLSALNDRIDIEFAEGDVQGSLDLSALAPALWDSLDTGMRSLLTYPAHIEPRETESIFVFVPVSSAKGMPRGLRYGVQTLGSALELRDRTAAAR
jgi:hypothetical protein